MTKNTDQVNRQITRVTISDKGFVKIDLTEAVPMDSPNGTEEEEEEAEIVANEYSVKSPRLPHKDFTDAMKKLRKIALDICEITIDPKSLTDYTVSQVSIAGDILLQQSRVVMTISKKVKRSEKLITIKTPQVTMYGESEYEKAGEMSKLVEAVVKEAWEYLDGKSEQDGQLALFPSKMEMA